LIRRFVEDKFDDRYLSTIGVKISRKTLPRGQDSLNLLIWDLAGGDDFRQTGTTYLRGAVGALIVCDLTRSETLAAWDYYARQIRAVNPTASIILAGNKVDLDKSRAISDAELQVVGDSIRAPFLLTSAKTGEQVEFAFGRLADLIEKV
jgi:small GTP-binding protein